MLSDYVHMASRADCRVAMVRSQQYHEGLTRSSRTRGSATDSQTKKDDLTLLHSIALDMESRG
jgi:hypothetical protein